MLVILKVLMSIVSIVSEMLMAPMQIQVGTVLFLPCEDTPITRLCKPGDRAACFTISQNVVWSEQPLGDAHEVLPI